MAAALLLGYLSAPAAPVVGPRGLLTVQADLPLEEKRVFIKERRNSVKEL